MAKDVIMPALGMAQETGLLLEWLKAPGDSIAQGEPLMLIETDKASVEIEAPASGTLANVTAQAGDRIPVGQAIAVILAPGERAPETRSASTPKPAATVAASRVRASPVAENIAAEHGIDLAKIQPRGAMIQKDDVLAYLKKDEGVTVAQFATARMKDERIRSDPIHPSSFIPLPSRPLASPKARRLAAERGLELAAIAGNGPGGAVLTADVLAVPLPASAPSLIAPAPRAPETLAVGRTWQIMVERLTNAWTTIPHFYLTREVDATQLMAWRVQVQKRGAEKTTITDLLVKLTAAALQDHPRLNAMWRDNSIALNPEINVGLAVAVEEGLVVPVIHHADELGLNQIAAQRQDLVAKAQANRLLLNDISGGTFTLSNLGMYGVDAFSAIINPPQAAILAVSRIADRVVAVNKQPAVLSMLTLTLSCDHRVADGARAAQFLQTLADLIEEPMRLLD
jgi:pyruvate dehydrogenase E2 component (dihydrolipoamide acetyltransferase)